jgi:hypothetical protein
MSAALLHYRAWQGEFRRPLTAVWPIARVALLMLLRRRLFWVLYGCGLLLFLMFFFGTYLFAWAEVQLSAAVNQPPRFGPDPRQVLRFVRQAMRVLNGGRDTFSYFYSYQGVMVIVTLSLAGAVLVGNDFNQRSLVFYLAKPIRRWHYLLGKCLAVAAVVTMMTTVPALVLYGQHVMDDWDYLLNPHYFERHEDVLNPVSFFEEPPSGPAGLPLLLGVLGYGTLLSVVLSILLVATASWMRRTMPLIMVWVSLFFFLRILANILVEGLKYDVHWRLLDLWNNLTLLGQACLGFAHEQIGPKPQPSFAHAAFVLVGVCSVCLIYLNRRTRGVEVVR